MNEVIPTCIPHNYEQDNSIATHSMHEGTPMHSRHSIAHSQRLCIHTILSPTHSMNERTPIPQISAAAPTNSFAAFSGAVRQSGQVHGSAQNDARLSDMHAYVRTRIRASVSPSVRPYDRIPVRMHIRPSERAYVCSHA